MLLFVIRDMISTVTSGFVSNPEMGSKVLQKQPAGGKVLQEE